MEKRVAFKLWVQKWVGLDLTLMAMQDLIGVAISASSVVGLAYRRNLGSVS